MRENIDTSLLFPMINYEWMIIIVVAAVVVADIQARIDLVTVQ